MREDNWPACVKLRFLLENGLIGTIKGAVWTPQRTKGSFVLSPISHSLSHCSEKKKKVLEYEVVSSHLHCQDNMANK